MSLTHDDNKLEVQQRVDLFCKAAGVTPDSIAAEIPSADATFSFNAKDDTPINSNSKHIPRKEKVVKKAKQRSQK